MEDAELVALALAEPEAGFARIYDTYAGRLYDYCYGILRSADEAGDALQDTFVAALTKLPQLRDPTRLRPWLYAIARNHCFKQSRNRTRERSADNIELIMPAQDEQNQPVESAELQQLVWDAVGGLSETDRAVIDLNVRHGLDGEELAAALGLSPSRSYVVVHRAKSRLESSVSALLVSKAGSDACDELAQVVGTDEFTPLVRKRVNRHIKACATCQETERHNRPTSLLALVPFVRLPPSLRGRVLGRLEEATPADVELGWRSDGFPAPVAATRFGPIPQGVLLAAAGAAIVLIIGLAPLDWLPTIGGDGSDETAASAGPTTTVDQQAVNPVTTVAPTIVGPDEEPVSSTDPASSPSDPSPSAAEGSTDVAGGTDTVPPSDPVVSSLGDAGDQVVLVDSTPPVVSSLRVNCDDPFVLEVTVTDTVDPKPVVDLQASWEDESSPPLALTDQGDGLYRAEVPSDERVGETIGFTVRGTARDAGGNLTAVERTGSCQFID